MNKFRFSGTGTTSGTFYISSLNREFNVLNTLRRKISSFSQCYYNGRNNSLVNLISATNLNISNNKIDYIFVDPPFGANIMYSELNSLWESWLHIRTDNTKEAIVNKTQNKTLFDYQTLMNASFKEFYRVLKPGKWLTMEFSNTSASVWNSIQNALQGVGFIIANVAALDKKQGSFKAVTTTTAVKQDLIISCFKPSEKLLAHFENMRQSDDNQNIFVSTQSFIEELLTRLPVIIVNEKKTTAVVERSPKILYDRLIAFFVQNGRQIPMDASEFQRFLRDTFVERDGMFFTAEQAIKYDDLRRQNPEMVSLALFVGSEADGVQWLKRELVDKPQTYQDLQPKWMQDLVAPKKGDAIPELMQILEENFLKNEDSQWYIPDAENEADLEKVRTRRLLREFKTYVEAAEKPKGRIKEARLAELQKFENYTFIKGNLADKVRINSIFEQYHPDIVVNLGAQAGVRYSITNPDAYIESNMIGFYNILEACRHYPVEHLVYASSSSVYGSNKKVPYSTDDKVDNPVSLYAATKKSNELMAHAYSKLYNIPSTGLRFFTVYGPAGRPDMAYFGFTNKLVNGETIKIFNYGNCKRDFTYVDDIVEGVVRVMAKAPEKKNGEDGLPIPPYAVYNIGNSNPENLLDFVQILSEELVRAGVLPADYDFEAHKELVPMQPGDVPVTFADTEPLERDFGFKPHTPLREGLRKFAEWYKEFYME